MSVLSTEPRREIEIHRYPALMYALVLVFALVLQAWLPRVLGKFAWFDLPLVVTVFFALSRRQPIQGSILGGGKPDPRRGRGKAAACVIGCSDIAPAQVIRVAQGRTPGRHALRAMSAGPACSMRSRRECK